jgi:hypothetical protein
MTVPQPFQSQGSQRALAPLILQFRLTWLFSVALREHYYQVIRRARRSTS